MLQNLKKILSQQKKRGFFIKELEDTLIVNMGKENYYQLGGYATFVSNICFLIEKEEIAYVSPKIQNGLNPPLPIKIKKIYPKNDKIHTTHLQNLFNTVHPKISLSYYQQSQIELKNDYQYIDKLNHFFMTCKEFTHFECSVNERSFQIFNNEKFLSSSEGKSWLKKINVNYTDLNCYETFEPFFYYLVQPAFELNEKNFINAIIVENKDTFFSLKKVFMENKSTYNSIHFSLLIYGEGKKIERSLDYINEITHKKVLFYYFGDLDMEGVSIFYRLFHRHSHYQILLLTSLYQEIINKNASQKMEIFSKQVVNEEHINFFCKYFSQAEQNVLRSFFKDNLRLPQEALRKDILENLFCEHQHT